MRKTVTIVGGVIGFDFVLPRKDVVPFLNDVVKKFGTNCELVVVENRDSDYDNRDYRSYSDIGTLISRFSTFGNLVDAEGFVVYEIAFTRIRTPFGDFALTVENEVKKEGVGYDREKDVFAVSVRCDEEKKELVEALRAFYENA